MGWFDLRRINTPCYNLSWSQSIIALSLIYPFLKSLGHAPFSVSFSVFLRCTPLYSCYIVLHLYPCHLVIPRARIPRKVPLLFSVIDTLPNNRYLSIVESVTPGILLPIRCIAMTMARTTWRTLQYLFYCCLHVFRPLPRIVSTCKNINLSNSKELCRLML
jgi:hypothetical protein